MSKKKKKKLKKLLRSKLIAIDTETTGLNAWKGDAPFGIGFCNEYGDTLYLEWEVNPSNRKIFRHTKNETIAKQIIEDSSITKVFFNTKFDMRMLWRGFGIRTKGIIEDVMIMGLLFNPLEPSHSLKALAKSHLKYSDSDEKDLKKLTIKCRRIAKQNEWKIANEEINIAGRTTKTETHVPADYWLPQTVYPGNNLCKRYCICDAERTMLLYMYYSKFLKNDPKFRKMYTMEMKLQPVVYRMETRGVKVNTIEVERLITKYEIRYTNTLRELRKIAKNKTFKPTTQQLIKLLYRKLKLPIVDVTPTGLPAVNKKALEGLLGVHPVIELLFRHRAYARLLSSNYYNYLRYTHKGILRTDFYQVGAKTGRFSSKRPNMQNPSAGEGISIIKLNARTPFIPRKEKVWYLFDYDQLEVIIFAHCSQEKSMLKMIRSGKNVHTESTNKVFGGKGNKLGVKALRQVKLSNGAYLNKTQAEGLFAKHNYDIVKAEESLGTKTSRHRIKTLFFAKLYGGGINMVSQLLNCTREEAEQWIYEYNDTFPGIVSYCTALIQEAEHVGRIYTEFGRKLWVHSKQSYCAVNYKIQGTAADLIKIAMIKIGESFKKLRKKGIDIELLLQIHDELVVELPKDQVSTELLLGIKMLMEDHNGVISLPTPVSIEIAIKNWGKTEKVKL
jgi:DNA polymerase-1